MLQGVKNDQLYEKIKSLNKKSTRTNYMMQQSLGKNVMVFYPTHINYVINFSKLSDLSENPSLKHKP
jgi:hypothetical protein